MDLREHFTRYERYSFKYHYNDLKEYMYYLEYDGNNIDFTYIILQLKQIISDLFYKFSTRSHHRSSNEDYFSHL